MKPILPHSRFLTAVILSAVMASLGLIGGLGLEAVREDLIAFTPLLIALPAVNAMAGDYAMLITSHIGDPETYNQRVRKLLLSLLISLPVSIVGITGVSLFIAWLQNYQFGEGIIKEYVVLISISLVAILAVMVLAIFGLNRMLKKSRLNSDDILIPIANTLASIMVLVSFAFIAVRLN